MVLSRQTGSVAGIEQSSAMVAHMTGGLFVPDHKPLLINIVVAAAISSAAAMGLLLYLAGSAIWRRTTGRTGPKGDPHMTAYFWSLLLADSIKAFGFLMSSKWIAEGMVASGSFCIAQGAIKQLGNVSSAVWTTVISAHLFNLLFLHLKPIKYSLPAVVTGIWALIFVDVFVGPAAIARMEEGFYGTYAHDQLTRGPWCWITDHYSVARLCLEYIPMATATIISLLLMFMILLRLRGNLYVTGSRLKLRWVNAEDAWHIKMLRDDIETRILMIVKRMIFFPLSYFTLGFLTGVSRLMQLTSVNQGFVFPAVTAMVFALSGAVDVLIYYITSRIMKHSIVLPVYADLVSEKGDYTVHSNISVPPRALRLGSQGSMDSLYKGERKHYDTTVPEFASVDANTPKRSPPNTAEYYRRYAQRQLQLQSQESRGTQAFSPSGRSDDYDTPRRSSSWRTATPATNFLSVGSTTAPRTGGTEEPLSGSYYGNGSRRSSGGVDPLADNETYKARMYGARFSLVAGPAPSYNLDRERSPVENRI